MNKHLSSIMALLLVACLVTDPLAEPAFTSSLLPIGGGRINSSLFIQEAMTGFANPEYRGVNTPWTRFQGEVLSRLGLPSPFTLNRSFFLSFLQNLKPGVLQSAQGAAQELFPPLPWKAAKPPLLNGWIADFNQLAAASALKNYTPHLQELSIFGVGANEGGHLAPETDFINAALASIKKLPSHPRALLTVANIRPNRNQDHWLINHWLGSPKQRGMHIAELLTVVGPVEGLDIDYENLQPGDGPRFTQFIQVLGQALHARHKLLTLTVEPQLLSEGHIDWEIINANVDRVRVMAYQFHYDRTSPGAVSPPAIVRHLAARALDLIPVEKLEIALPIYGFDWDTSQTDGPRGHGEVVPTMGQFKQLAQQRNAWAFRDPVTQSARIDYFAAPDAHQQPMRHEVWFEDPISVAYKVKMLQGMGVTHLGLWQLGVGDISELFDLLDSRAHPTHEVPAWYIHPMPKKSSLTSSQLIWKILVLHFGQYDLHLSAILFSHQTALPFTEFVFSDPAIQGALAVLHRVDDLLPSATQLRDVTIAILHIALTKAF